MASEHVARAHDAVRDVLLLARGRSLRSVPLLERVLSAASACENALDNAIEIAAGAWELTNPSDGCRVTRIDRISHATAVAAAVWVAIACSAHGDASSARMLLRMCDIAIASAPDEAIAHLRPAVAVLLTTVHADSAALDATCSGILLCNDDRSPAAATGLIPLPQLDRPSLQGFMRAALVPGLPALLRGTADHWPAAQPSHGHWWGRASYWCSVAGDRTVPVEVGGNYMSPAWRSSLVTVREFLRQWTAPPDKLTVPPSYLAQTDLFRLIPSLGSDAPPLDYCYADSLPAEECLRRAGVAHYPPASEECDGVTPRDSAAGAAGDGERHVVTNVWVGPAGTISNLHFDVPHNLFVQVVGVKRLLLYAPRDDSSHERMYPHAPPMHNTSRVDPLEVDRGDGVDSTPLFPHTPDVVVEVGPGDCLYIPPGWWHHVTALTPSASVSMWWR